ncbi:hypothetical protein EV127DRAFT_482141 [Xylaria flabelliformis]|nr:hypothetical protein EV127DRAFT_482141 [Xylaria flabelliformis]
MKYLWPRRYVNKNVSPAQAGFIDVPRIELENRSLHEHVTMYPNDTMLGELWYALDGAPINRSHKQKYEETENAKAPKIPHTLSLLELLLSNVKELAKRPRYPSTPVEGAFSDSDSESTDYLEMSSRGIIGPGECGLLSTAGEIAPLRPFLGVTFRRGWFSTRRCLRLGYRGTTDRPTDNPR